MNQKKSGSNEVYKEDEMKSIWLEYGHDPDISESEVSERDVK